MYKSSLKSLVLHCVDRLFFPPHKVSRLTYTDKVVLPKRVAEYNQRIPFKVWQTWRTIHMPPRLQRVVRRFRRMNPEYSHYLYTDRDCDKFIREHFSGTHVESAYFRINPDYGSARADFWRYCVLYQYGGVYLDIDSTCVVPLHSIIQPDDEVVLSHESNSVSNWAHDLDAFNFNKFLQSPPNHKLILSDRVLLQWLLIYTPDHPFLKQVIEDMSQAVLSYKEDKSLPLSAHIKTLALTGPLRYTDSVWKVLNSSRFEDKTYRVDDIDFGGKAIFQFPGQEEKNRQSQHYTTLTSPFVID